jgi:tetratricopeptide (TPR) repeat protein
MSQLDDAADLFQQALMLYRDLGSAYGETIALIGLGTVAHKSRRDQEAVLHYESALELALSLDLPDLARVVRTNLGFLAELAGDQPRAERWYVSATETIEAGRRDLPEENLRIAYLAHRLDPFEHLVLITWRQHRLGDSLTWCEAGRSRALLDLLQTRAAPRPHVTAPRTDVQPPVDETITFSYDQPLLDFIHSVDKKAMAG